MKARPLRRAFFKIIDMNKFFYIIAILILPCFIFSCGKKDKKLEMPTEQKMVLEEADTSEVYGLISEYMTKVVNKEYESAITMLRTVENDDLDGEPFSLSNDEEKQELRKLELFPINNYHVEWVKFKRHNVNEVKVKVYLTTGQTTNWYFKPVRYLGKWYLCIKDSNNGDETL